MNAITPTPTTTGRRIRVVGAAMLVTVLAELLLGLADTFWLPLPDSGSGWNVAAPAALLMARMMGTALLVLAIWITFLAWRHCERAWLTASALGIVIAVAGGSSFISDVSNDGASSRMAVGCTLAIAGYAYGLHRLPTTATAFA